MEHPELKHILNAVILREIKHDGETIRFIVDIYVKDSKGRWWVYTERSIPNNPIADGGPYIETANEIFEIIKEAPPGATEIPDSNYSEAIPPLENVREVPIPDDPRECKKLQRELGVSWDGHHPLFTGRDPLTNETIPFIVYEETEDYYKADVKSVPTGYAYVLK
jgi:hypothetical protein